MNFDYYQFSNWNLSASPIVISSDEILGMKVSLLSGDLVENKTIMKSASETECSINSNKNT